MHDSTQYIPLDKSWIIRMGILDLIHNRNQITQFLEKKSELNADLRALLHATKEWPTHHTIHVGESGTLYRFLQFASWKRNLNKEFVKEKTLVTRKITSNPAIIELSQSELLQLDNNTSQWASAAALLGDTERLKNPLFKLKVTYDAIAHWNERTTQGKDWEPQYDTTIKNQAEAFTHWHQTGTMNFHPEQAEDYCFARAFNLISKEEGTQRWPSLAGHESNRLVEMEQAIHEAEHNQPISSRDHRVVQAIALRYHTKPLTYRHPEAVHKSWSQFWEFLQSVKSSNIS